MISRYYHTPDGERCRLFAIRPRDTMSAEHPGCLMVTLQPIARGIVLAERGTCLGWFSLEDIESYHQHILAQGWECFDTTRRMDGLPWIAAQKPAKP